MKAREDRKEPGISAKRESTVRQNQQRWWESRYQSSEFSWSMILVSALPIGIVFVLAEP
jgi:hypothetical protein